MALMSILYSNEVQAITLDSGVINEQFPISNILLDRTSAVCRSTGTSMGLVFDLGFVQTLDSIILVGDSETNLGFLTATARISNTLDFTALPDIALDINTDFNKSINKITAQVGRYIRIEFTGSTVVEVSKVLIGDRIEYDTIGFEVSGFSQSATNTSNNNYNKNLTRYSDINAKATTLTGLFHTLSNDEKADLEDYFTSLDTYTPYFIMVDPEDNIGSDGLYRYSLYCHNVKLPDYKPLSGSFWDMTIEVQEEK